MNYVTWVGIGIINMTSFDRNGKSIVLIRLLMMEFHATDSLVVLLSSPLPSAAIKFLAKLCPLVQSSVTEMFITSPAISFVYVTLDRSLFLR